MSNNTLSDNLDEQYQNLADGKRVQYDDVRLYYKAHNGVFLSTQDKAIGFLELSSGIGMGVYKKVEDNDTTMLEEETFMKFAVSDETAIELKRLVDLANAKSLTTSSSGGDDSGHGADAMYV